MFPGQGPHARAFRDWLLAEAEQARSNDDLARRFIARCRETMTILPAITTIERLCADALVAAERRIEKRIKENHKVPFGYDDEVVKLIVSRCTELESGGRMVDAILTNTMLPAISEEFLTRMVEGKSISRVQVQVKDGDFAYEFE